MQGSGYAFEYQESDAVVIKARNLTKRHERFRLKPKLVLQMGIKQITTTRDEFLKREKII